MVGFVCVCMCVWSRVSLGFPSAVHANTSVYRRVCYEGQRSQIRKLILPSDPSVEDYSV